ncbi:MAG TPA: hypothetical protein VD866_05905 [Urbifossiella sp.]|nr:hypothetical protein [Urbifossiella sp.]
MPSGKTQADRLLELERNVPGIAKQLEATEKAADALGLAHQQTVDRVTELRIAYEATLAVTRKELDDLRKWKDDQKKEREEWARRVWAFGPSVLGAVVGALITLLFTYLIRR